jgi:hypothetical protein
MFYLQDSARPHYVSLKTGKQYHFKRDATGVDRQRALLELEHDDTPRPEPPEPPEPASVTSQPKSQPRDVGVQARIDLDQMKLTKARRK